MPKVLFISGGWEGHEPQKCTELVSGFLKSKGWTVQISDTLDSLLDVSLMRDLSLIVPVWTMGTLSPEQSQALRQAVASGVGLAGWHGGLCDAFRSDPDYQFMTGGQWVAHPGNIIRYTVNIKQDTDGLMEGLKDFGIESEQYYMHVDPGNEVLATTTFTGQHGDVPWIAGTIMPVVWKRKYGKGRVFYSALGHVAKEFEIPEVREIMQRGLAWAACEPVAIEYKSK